MNAPVATLPSQAIALGIKFVRWGFGWALVGIFCAFVIIGHYIRGAVYATDPMFLHNMTLWFACPWTLPVYVIQLGSIGMVAIGTLYLTLGKLYSVKVSRGEQLALGLCITSLGAILCCGLAGYFVVDHIWPGFYYKPIAEGKNVWLLAQAACCALYFIAIILVTMGVRRSTQAINS
jgi:hypothetical protein